LIELATNDGLFLASRSQQPYFGLVNKKNRKESYKHRS